MIYLIVLILILLVYVFVHFKLKIKIRTFFHRGFLANRGQFGVYCFCGKQGRGKTYSVVEFLKEHSDMKIFANISSIKGVDYTYFSGFEQLLDLRQEHNCIIVYDEIFTALTKGSKLTTDVLDFLSQMRKREIIFLTTAQEWLEINITLRRYCRYQIECNIRSFGWFSILIKSFYDAEQMQWDNLANEYVAPIISTTISKCQKRIANSYDTYEVIDKKSVPPRERRELTSQVNEVVSIENEETQ